MRIAIERGATDTFGLREITVEPLEWSASRNAFFTAVAADAPPGSYPKYMTGVQSYWTVAGVDGDRAEVLVNEEGMVEARKGGYSIEPFVYVDDTLFTWHDVTSRSRSPAITSPSRRSRGGAATGRSRSRRSPSSADGTRPSPTCSTGSPATLGAVERCRIYLAIRPFQVNPPWQFLNTPGGVARINQIALENGTVHVNGEPGVVPLTPPAGFGAVTFDQGNIVDYLRAGQLPPAPNVRDTFGHASGALAWSADVDSATAAVIEVALPLHPASVPQAERERVLGLRAPRDRVADARRVWRDALERTFDRAAGVRVARSSTRCTRTSPTSWSTAITPALQPGSRSYERSWIRDGSLDGDRAPPTRPRRRREELPRVVRRLPVSERQGAVLRRLARRRSRARARQPRRVHLPRRRVLASHATIASCAERLWPNVLARRGLHRLAAAATAHARVPGGDKRAFYGLLPPVHQPRGLLGQADALVLG